MREGGPARPHQAYLSAAQRVFAVRASLQQAEQVSAATGEAGRVAAELQKRYANAKETSAAVGELAKLVHSSAASVERVAAEVAALRRGAGGGAGGGGAGANGSGTAQFEA